jgi:hypothetical protein
LRLHLTVVRSRPLFRLGLRRFCCHDACASWVLCLLDTLLCACCNRRTNHLTVTRIPSGQQRKRGGSPAAHGLHQKWCCLRHSCLQASPLKPHCSRQTPQCACFHHLTLCENALAVSFAGVVHPLHPLAGIDSARLLLFSGDAISYMSNRRAQSALNHLNCLAMFRCSTASLLYPFPGWPASAA